MNVERESIFVSALRSFCRMFFGLCGIFLAFVFLAVLYDSLSSGTTLDQKTKLEYLPDAEMKKEVVTSTAPVVLQLNIHGVIGDPKCLDAKAVQNILVDSRLNTLKGNRVKAILLHINSPGGTVVDADDIYRMLKEYKQQYQVPIFAYIDGLCASGGMYIACAADRIYASPASIVGSVGVVIGPFFNAYEALGKLGLKAKTITEGLDKDMMNPFRPWKEGEDASLKAVTAFFYERFVELVASNRPQMDKEKLVAEYGAKIYDAVEGEKLGYVDVADAHRKDALLALLQEAKIDSSKPYQVVELEPKSQWLSNLFSKSPLITGKIEHSLDTGIPQIKDQIAYLYQPAP